MKSIAIYTPTFFGYIISVLAEIARYPLKNTSTNGMISFLFKVGMIGILVSMVDLKQWRREIGLIIPRIAMAKILNALLKLL